MAEVMRSPNYPVASIEQAMERVKMIYKAARFGKAAEGFLATSMGYKGLSGASRSMLATLKKYGLLESEGDGFKLTELAKTMVMLDANDPRYIEAVRKAALTPPLFTELYETYGDDLPDDNSLRFLLVGKKFLPDVAKDVVRIYRETLEFLQRLAPLPASDENQEREDIVEKGIRTVDVAIARPQYVGDGIVGNSGSGVASTKTLQVSIEDCTAYVRFDGQVTKEAVQKLVKYLDLFAEEQPSKEELRSSQSEKKDASHNRDDAGGNSQDEVSM